MKTKNKDAAPELITIQRLVVDRMKAVVIGTSPLLMNRMAEKARQQLLLPPKRKNSADKRSTMKHDPVTEFRSSVYKSSDPLALTALHLPSGSFSKSMAQAALDLPGTSKAQIQRLVRVPSLSVSVYGIPKLHMGIVRTMGINKTPDIRTRAILPRWAATFDIQYACDLISSSTLVSLLAGAGFLSGVGDWRGEKGGSHGGFDILKDENEAVYEDLIENEGREAQMEALENPEPFDEETAELFNWFEAEVELR